MSSAVPAGWNTVSLAEGIDILSGYPFDSSSFTDDSSKTGLIRIRDLVRQKVATYFDSAFDDNYLIRKGDVLIGMDGDFNIVKWNSAPSLLNQRICKVTVAGEIFDLAYLYQDLQKDLLEINNQTGSTTVKHLSVKDIRGIHKSYPPLPEQKKIASILTSVDEVIENTQKQIDKLQDLKKATMNELLTKGIGHTEFKDSELGRIPKSWEVVSLRSLASQIKRGPSLSCNTNGHGVRYITSGNLVAGEVSLNGDYKFLDNFSDIEKCRLVANDLVLNCVNSSAKIGGSAIFELDIEAIVGFNNYAITLDSAVCVPRFIHHFCQTYLFRAQLKTVIKDAINQVSFSTKDLDLIRIALPSLDEQYRIAESINVIWMKEKTHQSQIDKLKSLKKSLMQDLLTGKVRVTVN